MALKALDREDEAKTMVERAYYLYPELNKNSKWLYYALKDMGKEEKAELMLERIRYMRPDMYEELYEYKQSPSNKTD